VRIKITKQAAKALDALDQPTRLRVMAGILGLTKIPPQGDIKTMQGYADGRKRLRVGKYRLIFRCSEEILYIMDLGARGDIYR
jgi:mRNA interferase RelE/StbE